MSGWLTRSPGNPKVSSVAPITCLRYTGNTPDKGTQLIFLDLGTPKAKEKIETIKSGYIDGQVEKKTKPQKKKGYLKCLCGLKDTLIANGIPKDEIAFIHDAKTDEHGIPYRQR